MTKSVLVVDDDDAIRILVARVFTRRGYETVSARDGDEAIEILKKRTFSLVVLDLMMPRTDGITVIKQISGTESPPAVIVMTAAVPSVVERVPGDMVWKIIAKPFEVSALLEEAEMALKARAASPARI